MKPNRVHRAGWSSERVYSRWYCASIIRKGELPAIPIYALIECFSMEGMFHG